MGHDCHINLSPDHQYLTLKNNTQRLTCPSVCVGGWGIAQVTQGRDLNEIGRGLLDNATHIKGCWHDAILSFSLYN